MSFHKDLLCPPVRTNLKHLWVLSCCLPSSPTSNSTWAPSARHFPGTEPHESRVEEPAPTPNLGTTLCRKPRVAAAPPQETGEWTLMASTVRTPGGQLPPLSLATSGHNLSAYVAAYSSLCGWDLERINRATKPLHEPLNPLQGVLLTLVPCQWPYFFFF